MESSTTSSIVAAITRAIVEHRLQPGSKLAEQTLAGHFGVSRTLVRRFVLNNDGRNPDGPLYDNASLRRGTYRLVFDVAAYFRSRGAQLPDPPFLDQVNIDFGVAHADQHYHVPLVCTPWTYSTYRGS